MSERNVSDVVEERRNTDEPLIVFGDRLAPPHGLDNAVRHPGRAQRMLKAGMNRGRENQISRPQLLYPPKPLKFRGIHQLDFESTHFDVAVDGVADQLPLTHAFYGRDVL